MLIQRLREAYKIKVQIIRYFKKTTTLLPIMKKNKKQHDRKINFAKITMTIKGTA